MYCCFRQILALRYVNRFRTKIRDEDSGLFSRCGLVDACRCYSFLFVVQAWQRFDDDQSGLSRFDVYPSLTFWFESTLLTCKYSVGISLCLFRMHLGFRNCHLDFSLGECVPNDRDCRTILQFDIKSSWTDYFVVFVAKVSSDDNVRSKIMYNVKFDDRYLTFDVNRKVDGSRDIHAVIASVSNSKSDVRLLTRFN